MLPSWKWNFFSAQQFSSRMARKSSFLHILFFLLLFSDSHGSSCVFFVLSDWKLIFLWMFPFWFVGKCELFGCILTHFISNKLQCLKTVKFEMFTTNYLTRSIILKYLKTVINFLLTKSQQFYYILLSTIYHSFKYFFRISTQKNPKSQGKKAKMRKSTQQCHRKLQLFSILFHVIVCVTTRPYCAFEMS